MNTINYNTIHRYDHCLCHELMGWNPDSGIPTTAKLIELGLDWLIDEVTR